VQSNEQSLIDIAIAMFQQGKNADAIIRYLSGTDGTAGNYCSVDEAKAIVKKAQSAIEDKENYGQKASRQKAYKYVTIDKTGKVASPMPSLNLFDAISAALAVDTSIEQIEKTKALFVESLVIDYGMDEKEANDTVDKVIDEVLDALKLEKASKNKEIAFKFKDGDKVIYIGPAGHSTYPDVFTVSDVKMSSDGKAEIMKVVDSKGNWGPSNVASDYELARKTRKQKAAIDKVDKLLEKLKDLRDEHEKLIAEYKLAEYTHKAVEDKIREARVDAQRNIYDKSDSLTDAIHFLEVKYNELKTTYAQVTPLDSTYFEKKRMLTEVENEIDENKRQLKILEKIKKENENEEIMSIKESDAQIEKVEALYNKILKTETEYDVITMQLTPDIEIGPSSVNTLNPVDIPVLKRLREYSKKQTADKWSKTEYEEKIKYKDYTIISWIPNDSNDKYGWGVDIEYKGEMIVWHMVPPGATSRDKAVQWAKDYIDSGKIEKEFESKQKASDDQTKQIQGDYQHGMSIDDIAKKYNKTAQEIIKIVENYMKASKQKASVDDWKVIRDSTEVMVWENAKQSLLLTVELEDAQEHVWFVVLQKDENSTLLEIECYSREEALLKAEKIKIQY